MAVAVVVAVIAALALVGGWRKEKDYTKVTRDSNK